MTEQQPRAQAVNRRRDPSDLTQKGRRTRQMLIDSARAVFHEQGYLDARLAAVTERAGVATGTLYTYFDDREELLAAIIDDAYARAVSPTRSRPTDVGDPYRRIFLGNRRYVDAYWRNADLMAIFDQAENVDEALRLRRTQRAKEFAQRNAQTIEWLQANGKADPGLDALVAAQALSFMVSTQCRHIYVHQPDPQYASTAGTKRLADQLTRLWFAALGLDAGTLVARFQTEFDEDETPAEEPEELTR